MTPQLALQAVGTVLLLLAGLNVSSSRVSLGWLGLTCWAVSVLVR